MRAANAIDDDSHEPILNPVDRISELLFGLFMALSFFGAMSVAQSGREEIRSMFFAALGCNLAWGLVDAVMYLVRTITERGRTLTLVRSVQNALDRKTGDDILKRSLSRVAAGLVSTMEIEAIRGRIMALASLPERPQLRGNDLLAALAIFLIVVASTFPVVLPFVIFDDVGLAKSVSRDVALVMLFFDGLALGRYAGYGSWKVGFLMTGIGFALVMVIRALGG